MDSISTTMNEIDHNVQKGHYVIDGMMSIWTRIKHKLTGGYKYKESGLPASVLENQPTAPKS